MNNRTKKFRGNKLPRRAVNLVAGQGRGTSRERLLFVFYLNVCTGSCKRMKRRRSLFNNVIRPLCCLSIPAQSGYEAAASELAADLGNHREPLNDSLSLTFKQRLGP